MKMNRITVISLMLASLVVVDTNAAWARAGQFARKVFVSKTGALSATLSLGYVGCSYNVSENNLKGQISGNYTNFSDGVHAHMQEFMQSRGAKGVNVLFAAGAQGHSAFYYKGLSRNS